MQAPKSNNPAWIRSGVATKKVVARIMEPFSSRIYYTRSLYGVQIAILV